MNRCGAARCIPSARWNRGRWIDLLKLNRDWCFVTMADYMHNLNEVHIKYWERWRREKARDTWSPKLPVLGFMNYDVDEQIHKPQQIYIYIGYCWGPRSGFQCPTQLFPFFYLRKLPTRVDLSFNYPVFVRLCEVITNESEPSLATAVPPPWRSTKRRVYLPYFI